MSSKESAVPAKNISSISVESVIVDNKILTNQTLKINNGLIQSIENHQDINQPILAGTLIPGFIDLQVNGGGGYLFNHSPYVATIEKIACAHQKFGTTGWLPTLITDSPDKMLKAADAVKLAREKKQTGVLGIHFEGPHLSVNKKGVHSAKYIRKLSQSEMEIYKRKDLGKVLVTLAPENVSPEVIAELVEAGVIVCLGHSNASFEQTQQALKAGATGFTHLFNAMSQFCSREPGMVGAALLNNQSYYGLILDGIHVNYDSVKLALKLNNNMMLVTDAMPTAGCEQDSFEFFGQVIHRDGNRLTDSEGRLAGSNLTMVDAVTNTCEKLDVSLTQASQYASFNPAKFLGMQNQLGSIAVGKQANMVLLDQHRHINGCWINGKRI